MVTGMWWCDIIYHSLYTRSLGLRSCFLYFFVKLPSHHHTPSDCLRREFSELICSTTFGGECSKRRVMGDAPVSGYHLVEIFSQSRSCHHVKKNTPFILKFRRHCFFTSMYCPTLLILLLILSPNSSRNCIPAAVIGCVTLFAYTVMV